MRKLWNNFWNFFKSRTWPRFRNLLLINLGVSLIIASLIWKLAFGKEFNLAAHQLDIDFFNTLGVVFTIIGLGIALYQIAELRTEGQIKTDTTDEVNKDHFVKTARNKITLLIEGIRAFQVKMNGDSYDEKALLGYVNQFNDFLFTVVGLRDHQAQLKHVTILNCENCLTLIEAIQNELNKDVDTKSFINFRRSHYHARINDILKTLSQFESALNR